MPALSNPATSTVLVTGSNGFIGSWIVGYLLEAGYTVRAAVRSEDRGSHLKEVYKRFSNEGKLKIWAVGDMTAPGAWDEAVRDVEGVIHAAASVHLHAKSPEEMIVPAVNGVLELLESIKKHGNRLRRVVYTSSCGAIKAFTSVPKTYSEDDWNDQAVQDCKDLGEKALPNDMYAASKTLAERELWKWYSTHQKEVKWDLVTLLPPFVFGPVIHPVASLASLNTSNFLFYQSTILGQCVATVPPFDNVDPLSVPSHGWVDVRDVAQGHALALSVPAAGGERICLVAGDFVWQDTIDAINAINPSPWISHTEPFPKGVPQGTRVRNIHWNTNKEKRMFGIKFKPLQETARDILADYEAHGWK